jgi:phospholipid/cholesterol/gamma-HCH transport system substrate-binding protein
MAKERNALRAGVFMVVSLALIVFVIITISGAGKFTESFTTYPIAFDLKDDVGGLRVGDEVRIGGVKVGDVRDIQIDPAHSAVIVMIDIPSKYRLSKDAMVRAQRELTGTASINIEGFGTGPELASNDFIVGQADQLGGLLHQLAGLKPDITTIVQNIKVASVKMNTDLDKFGQTSDSFTTTGMEASSTIQSLRVRIPEIIDRYESVVAAADRMLDAIRDFVGPSSRDFHETVANLNQITSNLKVSLPQVVQKLDSALGKAGIVLEKASSAMRDVQATAKNLKLATGTLNSILTDNHGKLNAIVDGLKATSDNLKYASLEIWHSPWRLLYQPKPGEVANLNIYDSVRQFSEGADDLDDAATSLRDVLKDPNADPDQVKRMMAHLNDCFDKFQVVQNKLWQEIKD